MFERVVEMLGGNVFIIMLVLLPVLFQVGMGILFFSGLFRPAMARVGLSAAAILFAANGLGRLLGIVLAGAVDSFNASGVLFEFGFAGAAYYLLRAAASSPQSLEVSR